LLASIDRRAPDMDAVIHEFQELQDLCFVGGHEGHLYAARHSNPTVYQVDLNNKSLRHVLGRIRSYFFQFIFDAEHIFLSSPYCITKADRQGREVFSVTLQEALKTVNSSPSGLCLAGHGSDKTLFVGDYMQNCIHMFRV